MTNTNEAGRVPSDRPEASEQNPHENGITTDISSSSPEPETAIEVDAHISAARACIEEVRRTGTGQMTNCPAHDDSNPSLSVSRGDGGRMLLYCHGGCPFDRVLHALGLESSDLAPGARGGGESSSAVDGATVQLLAEAKQLPEEFLRGLGLTDIHASGKKTVRVPYSNEGGEEAAVRFRRALYGPSRFSWRNGSKVMPYGLDRLAAARQLGWVLLVEGESDCWTAWYHRIPAVGIPGKSVWKSEWAEYFTGLDVVVWEEPEARDLSLRLGRDLPNLRVITAPEYAKDLSEAHIQGRDIPTLLASLREASTPAASIRAAERSARLEELRVQVGPVLEAADPLPLIEAAIRSLGYGGDIGTPMITYLAVTSRVLAMRNGTMLAHLLLLGPASAGKSYSYQVILRLLPAGTYRVIDAGSPRVLIYDSADYKHRVLIYGEADSLPAGEDNPAASAIRNLLQDNRLHYEVVGKNPFTGEFGVQEVDKEGPTVLITTSTRPLGHQLGTRLFSLEVADNPNQVRAALQARAALEVGRAPEPDPVLVAFQEYLQLQAPWDVVVPFALLLAAEIGRTNAAARMNRDFQRLLSLIKAVTILRHARRERDDQGRLIATLDDYRAVRDRTNHMYEGTVSGASQQVREVVETVAALIAESTSPQTATVTAKEVGDRLGIDKSSASRRIRVALREDWLINQEDRRGRPQKLRVGEPLPNRRGLPVPEQLRGGEGTSSHGDDRNRATAPPTEDQPASAVSDDDCTVAGPTEDHGIPSSPDDDDGDDDGGGGDGGCAVAPTTESRDPSPSPAQTPTPATLSSPDVDVLSPTRHRLITTQSGLEEVLPDLLAAPMVGLDTETTGLDSRSDRLRVVQLATRDQTYIIDCFQVDPRVLAPVLEGARRFVGHNLKFDLGFLSAAGLPMPNGDRLFDTMLAAQLLGAGADEGRLQQCGLAAVVRRELGIDLDKGHQTSDWSGPLTDAQFAYAARDAATLPILAKLLGAQLTAAGLERVAEIEMGALPAITWLEQAGAPFDSPRWSYLADSARERARTLAGEIREILGIPINPNSHPQVKGALAELGIELDSTKEAALLALTDRHPVISKLLEHRQATKMGGAFGSRFLQYVDSETGRVHGDYLQIGAASGRMACSKPNLQNIPRDPAYRACFRPDSSRVLVKADYSQIELRIVAELTGEPRMLQAYRDGEDIHAVTAAAVLGRAGQSISSEDRQAAKSFNFGLIFGMGAPKLRGYALTNYGVSLTDVEAVEFRRRFLETYDGLREWHRSQPSDPVDTSTFAGRRRRGVSVFTEKLNTPVQGTAADGFKSALGLLWETRDRFPGAAPVLCVHDELVVECDRDQAEAVAAWVVECMTDGMQPFLPRVPVVVETKITGDWSGE